MPTHNTATPVTKDELNASLPPIKGGVIDLVIQYAPREPGIDGLRKTFDTVLSSGGIHTFIEFIDSYVDSPEQAIVALSILTEARNRQLGSDDTLRKNSFLQPIERIDVTSDMCRFIVHKGLGDLLENPDRALREITRLKSRLSGDDFVTAFTIVTTEIENIRERLCRPLLTPLDTPLIARNRSD